MNGFANGEQGMKVRKGKKVEVGGCLLTFDREVYVHVEAGPGMPEPWILPLERGDLRVVTEPKLTKG